MHTRIRTHLTYANVMSSIAVFAVLGGSAYAISRVGPNDIRKNAVRAKHIKSGQVKTRDAELVRYARAPKAVQTGGALNLTRVLRVRAKRGDLLAVHGRVDIRVLSGAGPCYVGLQVDGPVGFSGSAMAAHDDIVYIGDDANGSSISNTKPRVLPVVEPGRYKVHLYPQATDGTTCEYKDRNLWVELIG